MQPAHADDHARPPRLTGAEARNQDLGRAWQARYRVEVARVKQQGRGDQFIERPRRRPAGRNRAEIGPDYRAEVQPERYSLYAIKNWLVHPDGRDEVQSAWLDITVREGKIVRAWRP